MSDVDKIKVIDKIEITDSESVFSVHENGSLLEICWFYLNKSDIHFNISSNSSGKSCLIEDTCKSYSKK